MKHVWCIVLLTAAIVGEANAQERYVPILGVAGREYGVSGSYMKQTVIDSNDVGDFAITARYGILTTLNLQLELESGYARHTESMYDTTGHRWNIAGNLLYNLSILSPRFSVFGLVGYGYDRTWGSVDVADNPDDGEVFKSSYKFLQYGFGAKYMLVANAGLRVDYRWVKPRGVAEDEPDQDRQTLMIGLSVFQ